MFQHREICFFILRREIKKLKILPRSRASTRTSKQDKTQNLQKPKTKAKSKK